MSALLHCCPVCSVAEPPGVFVSAVQLRNYYRQPSIWTGRRSGKYWITRSSGCTHGPAPLAGNDSQYALASAWNKWAETEALAKADRLAYPPEQRARWLYGLGIGRLEDVLAVEKQRDKPE